ncbi:MAG: hypothetical protein HOP10_04255 [Chitinophagaceae bacterium]|nr:hypothetical protein [Chitinophagaceae bacterium]
MAVIFYHQFRYSGMRWILLIGFIFFNTSSFAQNCEPNTTVKVQMFLKDSASSRTIVCDTCRLLYATDSNYSIVSFRMIVGGEGFEDVMETFNQGPFLSKKASFMLSMIRPGSFLELSCISAKNKDGRVYILQPFSINIK